MPSVPAEDEPALCKALIRRNQLIILDFQAIDEVATWKARFQPCEHNGSRV